MLSGRVRETLSGGMSDAVRPADMRALVSSIFATSRTTRLLALLLASTSLAACIDTSDDYEGDEDLGDIGDGKSDSFGIVDKSTYVNAGKTRAYTFSANAAFRLAITQAATTKQNLEVSITGPDGAAIAVDSGPEPTAVH